MSEQLRMRVHGPANLPALVYCPGLHGDWTLIGGLRHALEGEVRFVEVTYPRSLDWSLAEYAQAIEEALQARGLNDVWLLGESFGSQIVWAMAARNGVRIRGIILAGGFVQHPAAWMVWLADRVSGKLPLSLVTRLLFGWAWVAKVRFYRSPEALASIDEFMARRTELDRQAAIHRLRLIAGNDACPIAATTRIPVYALTGLFDPVVPWPPVRSWLRKHCPALRDHKVIGLGDHSVLCSAAPRAAELILDWMGGQPMEPAKSATTA